MSLLRYCRVCRRFAHARTRPRPCCRVLANIVTSRRAVPTITHVEWCYPTPAAVVLLIEEVSHRVFRL